MKYTRKRYESSVIGIAELAGFKLGPKKGAYQCDITAIVRFADALQETYRAVQVWREGFEASRKDR